MSSSCPRQSPNKDHLYGLYDPDGEGCTFYKTAKERDEYAKKIIESYLDDGAWSDDVTSIFAFEVTHQATQVDTIKRKGELDEDGYDENSEYWPDDDIDYKCNYALMRIKKVQQLADTREELQTSAWQGIEPEQVLQAVEALASSIGFSPSAPTLPQPIAWCNSKGFEEAQAKRQSFNGWREPYNDCDMALYAGPAPALPLPVSRYDAGDGVTIEASNHERTQWAVRCSGECLNRQLTWEHEPTPSDRGHDFLTRCRWASAEWAYAALQASRSTTAQS